MKKFRNVQVVVMLVVLFAGATVERAAASGLFVTVKHSRTVWISRGNGRACPQWRKSSAPLLGSVTIYIGKQPSERGSRDVAAAVSVQEQTPTVAPLSSAGFDKILIAILRVTDGRVRACDAQYVKPIVIGRNGKGRAIGSTPVARGRHLIQVFVTSRSVNGVPGRVLLASPPIHILVS